jgi:hypothetical protein
VFVVSFVRPGCTQLTVVAALSAAEAQQLQHAGPARVAEVLLQRSQWRAAAGQQSSSAGAGEAWSSNMLVGRALLQCSLGEQSWSMPP